MNRAFTRTIQAGVVQPIHGKFESICRKLYKIKELKVVILNANLTETDPSSILALRALGIGPCKSLSDRSLKFSIHMIRFSSDK